MEEEARLTRLGLNPEHLEVYETCCRNRGFVLRPLMCRFETTDGFDYVQGMKNFPECLLKNKECYRGLDPSFSPETDEEEEEEEEKEKGNGKGKRKVVKPRHYMKNYDRWVEQGITKSPVIAVADRRNKIRGVMVRYRNRMIWDMEGAGDDIRLVGDDDNKRKGKEKSGEQEEEDDDDKSEEEEDDTYAPGTVGLKVIDFRTPGVEYLELQLAMGEAVIDIFDCFDEVHSVILEGGGGPSFKGDVNYPIVDAPMQRYMDMDDNVRRLALGLGFERELEGPPGKRWMFRYQLKDLNGLCETLEDLNMAKDRAEMNKKQEREKQYRKQLVEDGKCIAVVGGIRTPMSTRVLEVSMKADTQRVLDEYVLKMLEQCNSAHQVRTREQGFRPMPMRASSSNTPLEDKANEDILGEMVEWLDRLPPLDSESSKKAAAGGQRRRKVVRDSAAGTPLPGYRGAMLKSLGIDIGKSAEVVEERSSPEEPTAFQKAEGSSAWSLSSESDGLISEIDEDKEDKDDDGIKEDDSDEFDGLIDEVNMDEDNESDGLIDEDNIDEDDYHFSKSPSLGNMPVRVENVENVDEEADDDKMDVEVDVKSVNPSSDDEDSSDEDSSDSDMGNAPATYPEDSSGDEADRD